MSEYNVIINASPLKLGLVFNDNSSAYNQCLYLEDIEKDSIAHQLGLIIGDQLIAVNGQSVVELSSLVALQLFNQQTIPFKATFKHSVDMKPSISHSIIAQSPTTSHNHHHLFTPNTVLPMQRIESENITPSFINPDAKKPVPLYQTPTLNIYTPDLTPTIAHNTPDSFINEINRSRDIDAEIMEMTNINSMNIRISGTDGQTHIWRDSSGSHNNIGTNDRLDLSHLRLSVYDSLRDSDYLSAGSHPMTNISVSISPRSSYQDIIEFLDINPDVFDENIDQYTTDLVTGFIRLLFTDYLLSLHRHYIKPHKSHLNCITYLAMQYLYDEDLDLVVVNMETLNSPRSVHLALELQPSVISDDGDDPEILYTNTNEDDVQLFSLSEKGFKKGKHEWIIKILKCDIYRQEIGIISHWDNNIKINEGGITDTPSLGARAFYGNELYTNSCYYASYNDNNKERIYKDLSSSFLIGWCTGDEIKVCLDCNKGNIKFFLNNQKVRKTISIQKNISYYPIISFSGNCKYEIISFT